MTRNLRKVSGPMLALVVGTALVASACGSSDSAGGTTGTTAASATSSVTASSTPSASSTDSGTSATSSASSVESSSSSSATESSATSSTSTGPTTVKIDITEADGCTVTPNTVAAGAVTFDIKNVDATAVVEVHLMQGERIRGERENLAPGFENTFSVTLDGGSYEIYCPGAKTENQPFTVTGSVPSTGGDVADLLQQATVDYSEYVSLQAGFLVEAVDELSTAINSGDLAKAQAAYAKARPFYERIEPVAESFGDLDPDIDAREGDVPAAQWKGFHPMEQALFVQKSVAKAKPYLADLVANVKKLQTLTTELQTKTKAGKGEGYKPDEVANGAASLLEEVQQSKISGEEERYSHIDLVDFAANVEGSQQAFAALQPALDKIDASLADPINAKFDALIKLLDAQKNPKALGGYTLYNDLSKADVKKLSDALLAVQEPLSQISAKVAAAG